MACVLKIKGGGQVHRVRLDSADWGHAKNAIACVAGEGASVRVQLPGSDEDVQVMAALSEEAWAEAAVQRQASASADQNALPLVRLELVQGPVLQESRLGATDNSNNKNNSNNNNSNKQQQQQQ
eukprot:CAMPEP_0115121614 /NCGR_PEP_ID=MMETSP0227-20121206/46345_1 /TAXON_ID=89957 /ORGANISM="Polarella glacialis, Strain CCMP 1383" /LENGTH=123 /DNA_ID=CAMNT_0002523415 /DNA_START=111 /DNA_END=478 /DNA_ORIENTATION=+